MSLVSIVVPVFHNAASLPDLVGELQALAARNATDRFEFIFVDDGSRDDSYAVMQRLAGEEARLRLVKLSRNFGSNAAVLAGLGQAGGDAVGIISADLQDPPALLDEMLERWRAGSRVVLAVRSRRRDPALARSFARVFYALFRRYAIPSMPKGGFDFFLVDRQVCDLINGIQEGNAYLVGLVLWLGFSPALISYERQARAERYGRSMWSFTRRVKYFVDAFVAFSYFPLRLASGLGIVLSTVGVLYAVVVFVARLFTRTEPSGYASLMVVVLVASGVQLFMTGILGEYVWRNLEETRRRPRFIIESQVGASALSPGSSERLDAGPRGRLEP